MIGEAIFSEDGAHRYRLSREWLIGAGSIAFIMLNPSTADASINDPTVKRCMGFAQDWGYKRLVVGNIFAFRTTQPYDLLRADDPIGPENDDHLIGIVEEANLVVCAWGGHGMFHSRGDIVRRNISINAPDDKFRDLYALGFTKDRQPKHPLYVRADTPLVKF